MAVNALTRWFSLGGRNELATETVGSPQRCRGGLSQPTRRPSEPPRSVRDHQGSRRCGRYPEPSLAAHPSPLVRPRTMLDHGADIRTVQELLGHCVDLDHPDLYEGSPPSGWFRSTSRPIPGRRCRDGRVLASSRAGSSSALSGPVALPKLIGSGSSRRCLGPSTPCGGGCTAPDRRHSVQVAREAKRRLGPAATPPVLAAALLHDVGKIDAALGHVGAGHRNAFGQGCRCRHGAPLGQGQGFHPQGRSLPPPSGDRGRLVGDRGERSADGRLGPKITTNQPTRGLSNPRLPPCCTRPTTTECRSSLFGTDSSVDEKADILASAVHGYGCDLTGFLGPHRQQARGLGRVRFELAIADLDGFDQFDDRSSRVGFERPVLCVVDGERCRIAVSRCAKNRQQI